MSKKASKKSTTEPKPKSKPQLHEIIDPFEGEDFTGAYESIDDLALLLKRAWQYFGKARGFLELAKQVAARHADFADFAHSCRIATSKGETIKLEKPDINWNASELRALIEEFADLPIAKETVIPSGYRVSATALKKIASFDKDDKLVPIKASGRAAKFLERLVSANKGRSVGTVRFSFDSVKGGDDEKSE